MKKQMFETPRNHCHNIKTVRSECTKLVTCKNYYFLLPETHAYVCVSEVRNVCFSEYFANDPCIGGHNHNKSLRSFLY